MDTEAVGGGGEVTKVGDGTSVGSSTGMRGTETGTGGMEVAITQATQAPLRDTVLVLIGHIWTLTDL